MQTLSNGNQVVNFSVAVNDNLPKQSRLKTYSKPPFLTVAYWLSTGVAPYLTKGTLVELEGRVSARAWLNREGEPQAGLNFHTSKIKFHFSKKAEVTPNTSASETNNANAITPLPKPQVTAGQVVEEDEDDLPF